MQMTSIVNFSSIYWSNLPGFIRQLSNWVVLSILWNFSAYNSFARSQQTLDY